MEAKRGLESVVFMAAYPTRRLTRQKVTGKEFLFALGMTLFSPLYPHLQRSGFSDRVVGWMTR
jgi:hypothetical protein